MKQSYERNNLIFDCLKNCLYDFSTKQLSHENVLESFFNRKGYNLFANNIITLKKYSVYHRYKYTDSCFSGKLWRFDFEIIV